jgi:NAD(P)-dependent dehydrogenase (short-subunit alcohol dehydrogenase family)
MAMELDGKVAFITGAGSGIGKASALRLAKAGCSVGVHARKFDEAEEAVDEIVKAGGKAIPLAADITDENALKQAIDRTAAHFGRLDIVFANAGINGVWAPLDDLKMEEFDLTIATNLRGTFATLKFAYPHLKKHGGSMIINSSINGTRVFSNSGATAYSVSKAGQVAMGRMLALELAKDKIRVNTICPGWIQTDIESNTEKRNIEKAMVPMEFPEGEVPLKDGGPGSSEEVAEAVFFLASDASCHITGTEIYIDGGESLVRG